MRTMARISLITATAILIAGFISAGCEPRIAESNPQARQAPEVAVFTVKPRDIELTTELPGRTASYMHAEIRPQVNGLIKKRLFKEGSDVEEGQLLYQIDPAPFKAALDSAEARLNASKRAKDRAGATLETSQANVSRQEAVLDLAKTKLRRIENLFQDKAVSASEHDEAVTNTDVAEAALKAAKAQVESSRKALAESDAAIQQAKAAVQTARINLGYTKITAPISGRIGRSSVTEGAIVTAYQPVALAVIQQMDPIYVDVPQSTSEMLRLQQSIKEGQLNCQGQDQNKVGLILENGSQYPQEGILQFRDVTVEPTTGSVILRIVFPNPDNTLLPGMFVRAVVREGIAENSVVVPQQGISRDPKGNPLALVLNSEGKVEQRMLKLDRAIGDKWLVSSGLSAGDRLIVEGMQKVRPGSPARAVPFQMNKSTTDSSDRDQPRA